MFTRILVPVNATNGIEMKRQQPFVSVVKRYVVRKAKIRSCALRRLEMKEVRKTQGGFPPHGLVLVIK